MNGWIQALKRYQFVFNGCLHSIAIALLTCIQRLTISHLITNDFG